MSTPVRSGFVRPDYRAAIVTRALNRFVRDDGATGRTTVRIDTSRTASAPIDRCIFGNFLEHLGASIYGGLSAQLLLNPNLERIEESDRLPAFWSFDAGAEWVDGGYRSPRAVSLRPNVQGASSGLSQMLFLPVHGTRRFCVTFFARAPGRPTSISLGLYRDGKEEASTLAEVGRKVPAGDWHRLRVSLDMSSSLPPAGEAVRFSLRNVGSTPVQVDQITMTPDDAVSGMDPDVLRLARDWRIPVMRYPGGNFASGYRWLDGVGDPTRRPTRRNPAWGGAEPNHFGTDEFLKLCGLLKIQPQITVNAGDGIPVDAADWVSYCNGDSEHSAMAALRAANGHVAPYGVRLWEIGNEVYGPWQIGHTDARGYAARFVGFRAAMRRADPTIQLIATGQGDGYSAEGMRRCNRWNETVLRSALAEGGEAPDYLSIHPLVSLPAAAPGASYDEMYESAMAQPAVLGDELLPRLASLISELEGPHAPTRIAVTEWGIIVGGEDWQRFPNHNSLAGAIFNALTLNAMLRNSDWVTLANMTAFMHGGGIKRVQGRVYADPQYYVQALYAAAQPSIAVETLVTGPASDVPARGVLPAVNDLPDVDVFAALTRDRRKLVIFAVNRRRTASRAVDIEVGGFNSRAGSAMLLTAPTPQSGNTASDPNAVRPHPFPLVAGRSKNGCAWHFTLPPHSLVVGSLLRAPHGTAR